MFPLSVDRCLEGSLTQGTPLFFSTLERVSDFVKEYRQAYSFMYESGTSSKELYCLVAEEYALDVIFPKKLSTHVYSPEGVLMENAYFSEDDLAEVPLNIHKPHQVGDIVEAPCGDSMYLGIVLASPLSVQENHAEYKCHPENCYSIITYPSMEVDYVHSPLVFKPKYEVNEKIKAHLKSALEQYRT